jgi:hypothetical protein
MTDARVLIRPALGGPAASIASDDGLLRFIG